MSSIAELVAELRRLAEAATAGPWIHVKEDNVINSPHVPGFIDVVARSNKTGADQRDRNAAYIAAANPAAILELLRHIEGLERDAQRYNALIESGDFTPSFIEGRWGLRCNGKKASKKELDAEVDKRIAALAEQGAP